MSILNIGTRALQANQVALQTAGNNIANVNTPGYSRQSVVLQTVEGQFTGSGYIGKGVDVSTIQRNFDQFLTRQSTLASSTQSADTTKRLLSAAMRFSQCCVRPRAPGCRNVCGTCGSPCLFSRFWRCESPRPPGSPRHVCRRRAGCQRSNSPRCTPG